MAANDAQLFQEVKRSVGLTSEYEKICKEFELKCLERDEMRKLIEAENEKLVYATMQLEETKEQTALQETQLEVTFESIKSLQQVLQEVQETTGKLAESERSHLELLSNLERDNEYNQRKIPSLEEAIRKVYEDAKLIRLEKQASESELKRQREENLDQLIGLQRECDEIKHSIQNIEKEILSLKIETGAVRSNYPLSNGSIKSHIDVHGVGSHNVSKHHGHHPIQHEHRPVQHGHHLPSIEGQGVDSLIANLVDNKILGLEEMVRQHVERRFKSLEQELYARTVPYPVYRGFDGSSAGSQQVLPEQSSQVVNSKTAPNETGSSVSSQKTSQAIHPNQSTPARRQTRVQANDHSQSPTPPKDPRRSFPAASSRKRTMSSASASPVSDKKTIIADSKLAADVVSSPLLHGARVGGKVSR